MFLMKKIFYEKLLMVSKIKLTYMAQIKYKFTILPFDGKLVCIDVTANNVLDA
jgi:hypothetical protein